MVVGSVTLDAPGEDLLAGPALGRHDDDVIELYRRCRGHRAEVPAEPARSTRDLMERLRR